MNVEVYTLNAFAKGERGGNPAGVVLEGGLSDTPDDAAAECRNFAPLYDIPEESATGTSNGALLSYLYQYGQLSLGEVEQVVFRQGYSMDCPSEIKAGLRVSESGEINQVRVGGTVVGIERRHITI